MLNRGKCPLKMSNIDRWLSLIVNREVRDYHLPGFRNFSDVSLYRAPGWWSTWFGLTDTRIMVYSGRQKMNLACLPQALGRSTYSLKKRHTA